MARLFFLSPILLLCPLSSGAEIPSKRGDKALWNLESMSECVLHYTALVYNNYGCWCGVGGGHEPVDPIDACCRAHDECYDAAIAQKECYDVPVEYLDDYSWTCEAKGTNQSRAVCADPSTQSECQTAMCECDRSVIDCWKKYGKPTSKPMCNGSQMRPQTKNFEH